jgi:hypothetical protein
VFSLSGRDVILPITALEWGAPDRWSFTSMYAHFLHERSNERTWHHSLTATLSPGWSGGRFGLGYLNIFDPPQSGDFGLISSLRVVLLRTWGEPLYASGDKTFGGLELKFGLPWLAAGVGYYAQISDPGVEERDRLWGFHCGVGL